MSRAMWTEHIVAEYAKRTDDELLALAHARHCLTDEARIALDAELRRRNLTESDLKEHQQFVKRMERREYRSPRPRKLFGVAKLSGKQMLCSFAVIAIVVPGYLALAARYHLDPMSEEASVCVLITFAFVVVGWRSLWGDVAFWITVTASAAAQWYVVHAWAEREGKFASSGRAFGKVATFLGFLMWIATYGLVWLVRKRLHRESVSATAG